MNNRTRGSHCAQQELSIVKLAIAAIFAVALCSSSRAYEVLSIHKMANPSKSGSQTMQVAANEKLTIQGVRLTMGDGVDCPKVRADDGAVTSVSYLAPSIEIGQRVEVSGFIAVMTTCRGRVLYAEEVRALGN
jgi:hypothetical protein